MKISIITLFPGMFTGFFNESIIKRAQEKKLVEIELVNLRDFAIDDYGTVDDRPYGGGAGMILRVEPMFNAISNIKYQISKSHIKNQRVKTVLTSAKGRLFNQSFAKRYSQLDHLIIIAGHYEGVDERVLDYVDEEISLGDFVMTGGEITAAAVIDSITRLIPGVLRKEDATEEESFFVFKEKVLLEYPHYTRPEEFRGKKVPEILLSGNHKKIREWRLKKAHEETLKKRPDLLKK